MKEIKFRVWTGSQMLSAFTLFDIQNERASVSTRDIIMQYTGVNDKNGKEVYEGDILKLWIDGYEQTSPSIVDNLVDLHTWINGNYHYTVQDFEVVGNKYENPDLEYLE